MKFDWRSRPYLFHVHTTYTDGQLTVSEYMDFAAEAGIETVLFLEHVRRRPFYDVDSFSHEVRRASSRYVRTMLGFEAKLLPDGLLDIQNEVLSSADVIGIAEHEFPNDPILLLDAFQKVLLRYRRRWPKVQFVWVHPGLWYRKRGLKPENEAGYLKMVDAAREAGVLLERNLRWDLLNAGMAATLSPESLVLGLDGHTNADLDRWMTENVPVRPARVAGGRA
jgi:histidinol phosphatase-like PHP family hydrolase